MTQFLVTREIEATVERVFDTVADIRNFSQALPHVVKYEFLSDIQCGLGTRFRETRLMQGREAVTELEVTEYEPHQRVRLVADSHGAIWDTLFTVQQEVGHTRLTMTMIARPYQWLPRIMNFLFRRLIRKAVERDMNLVKAYCETGRESG